MLVVHVSLWGQVLMDCGDGLIAEQLELHETTRCGPHPSVQIMLQVHAPHLLGARRFRIPNVSALGAAKRR